MQPTPTDPNERAKADVMEMKALLVAVVEPAARIIGPTGGGRGGLANNRIRASRILMTERLSLPTCFQPVQ